MKHTLRLLLSILLLLNYTVHGALNNITAPDQPSTEPRQTTQIVTTPAPDIVSTVEPTPASIATPTIPATSPVVTPTLPVTAAPASMPALEPTKEIMPAAPAQPVATPIEDAIAKIETEKKEIEQLGIDTIDIEEGGNWLLKRKALEDTVDVIEQINRLFTKILEARMDYKIKRNQLDSEYDSFVANIGFDLGDVDELLDTLLERLELERKQEGDLSPEERTLFEQVNQNKNEINQLKDDLKKLHEFESNVNDVLMTVENQINVSNEHQNQAWRNFQLIKKILSDEKAEELYYNTDGLYKSLQEIYSYLTSRLSQYFNEQLQAVRDQMSKIKAAVESLKNKGIDLKKESEKLENAEREREKIRAQQDEKREIDQAVKKATEEQRQKGWWQWFVNAINSFFATLFAPVRYLISSISGLFVKQPIQPQQPPVSGAESAQPQTTASP